MKPTDEQVAICASQAEVIKIKAFAGTGKTTTLRGVAARHQNMKILYLAFNKAIKEEAQGKFVSNVRAMTAHGLAYASVGKHYGNVPNKLGMGDLKPFHVLPLIEAGAKRVPLSARNLYGARVIEAIKNYLISPDIDLLEDHVVVGNSPAEKKSFGRDRILSDAHTVWAAMQDLKSPMPMTHDGYLKLFQRDLPDLGYDMVMVDEYQDTNPVLQSLVDVQTCRKIYVGDEHQAIYGFRGARNAMASAVADEEFILTGSFRFGPEIAAVANAMLEAKGERVALRGLGSTSVLGDIPAGATHTYISRGNAALFARAVAAVDKNEPFAFVGPLYNYRLDLIEQAYRLSNKEKVSDPFLKAFDTFTALEEYAEAMEDREISGRCRMVNKYGSRLPPLISMISARAGTYPSQPKGAQVILTSAHRAKGLEFEHVALADDFMDFYDDEQGLWKDLTQADAHDREEVNLQYVAATRAQKTLEMGAKLQAFLAHAQASSSDAADRARPPRQVEPYKKTGQPMRRVPRATTQSK
jgi:F-box protein 18 (helicase)